MITEHESWEVQTVLSGEWATTLPLDLLMKYRGPGARPLLEAEAHALARVVMARGIICRVVKIETRIVTTTLATLIPSDEQLAARRAIEAEAERRSAGERIAHDVLMARSMGKRPVVKRRKKRGGKR